MDGTRCVAEVCVSGVAEFLTREVERRIHLVDGRILNVAAVFDLAEVAAFDLQRVMSGARPLIRANSGDAGSLMRPTVASSPKWSYRAGMPELDGSEPSTRS